MLIVHSWQCILVLSCSYDCANPVFGKTLNPLDRTRTPGGASGGSAVMVASGSSFLGFGTDSAGGIRLPAHFCGVVGFKPTSARIRYVFIIFIRSNTTNLFNCYSHHYACSAVEALFWNCNTEFLGHLLVVVSGTWITDHQNICKGLKHSYLVHLYTCVNWNTRVRSMSLYK